MAAVSSTVQVAVPWSFATVNMATHPGCLPQNSNQIYLKCAWSICSCTVSILAVYREVLLVLMSEGIRRRCERRSNYGGSAPDGDDDPVSGVLLFSPGGALYAIL